MPTETTTNNAPEVNSEAHLEAMAARYRDQGKNLTDDDIVLGDVELEAQATEVPQIPEGGFEKFYNKETGAYDWANHAKELQYRLEQATGKKPGAKTEVKDEAPKPEEGDKAQSDILAQAGLDETTLAQQIATTGDIGEEARKALVKIGIPESLINTHIENFRYRQEAERTKSLEYVGGEEEWGKLESWARDNLSDPEKLQINQLLASNNWKMGVDYLKAKAASSLPTFKEGRLETNGSTESSGRVAGYRSTAERTRDMNDPRYKTDPAFREQVYEKMRLGTYDLDRLYG